jgi:hypothetical protein
VLVLVDTLAHVIRFAIEMALVLLGQMAVVLRHVFLFIVLQALFTALQAPGFSRSKLATLNAVGDAVLLVRFALINLIDPRMTGIDLAGSGARGVVFVRSGSGKHQTTHRKNQVRLRDFVGDVRLNPAEEVLLYSAPVSALPRATMRMSAP